MLVYLSLWYMTWQNHGSGFMVSADAASLVTICSYNDSSTKLPNLLAFFYEHLLKYWLEWENLRYHDCIVCTMRNHPMCKPLMKSYRTQLEIRLANINIRHEQMDGFWCNSKLWQLNVIETFHIHERMSLAQLLHELDLCLAGDWGGALLRNKPLLKICKLFLRYS